MRIFAFALVASSAVLPRRDGVSDAADPSTIAHQVSAVVPPTAVDVDSLPSRLLRSQAGGANKSAQLAEVATSLLGSSRKNIGFNDAMEMLADAQTKLTQETVNLPAMRDVMKKFSTNPSGLVNRLLGMGAKEISLARALYDMQLHSVDVRKPYWASVLAELTKRWHGHKLTKVDMFEKLGLAERSFSWLFDEEGIVSLKILMSFYTAVDGKQGPISLFGDLVKINGGRESFKKFVATTTNKEIQKNMYGLFSSFMKALLDKQSPTKEDNELFGLMQEIARENLYLDILRVS